MILKDTKHNSFIEMKVDNGYFHMAAQVRLKALLEMYLWGFLIALAIHTIKKKWRQRHEK